MAFPPSILIITPLLFLLTKSFSDPRSATEAALVCSNRTAEPANHRAYVANYLAAMESVRAQVSMNGSGAAVNGTGSTKIYALADCMRDLSRNDCLLCVELCKVHIHMCMPFQTLVLGGRIYFDGCFLRFDSYRFFGESEGFNDGVVCGRKEFGGNGTLFRKSVGDLVRDLKVGGVKNNGFFSGSVGRGEFRVYGLVQCWRFVRGLNCERCLGELVGKIGDCLGKEDVRVLNSGCYLRYSTQKFYHDSRRDSARRRNRGDKLSAIILAGASAGIAIVLLVATVTFFLRKQIVKQKREKEQLDFLATVTKSKLIFSYETLEKATKYFHDSHKIGEGGSGHVYRGKLPDGRTVAIKRILFDTKQWVEHFFNEVNLISNINHKNHVKLLGYSITGPESLLVYEYMPNQSLHHYFFAKKNAKPLIWEVRYKIIVGAAEGLAYLHEESNLRIIHRDIKLSNILLDEDFNAKIADFGLARLFPEDKTHLSSAIAGTLGYMAPEYVLRGQLTEKADIYSFGVLIIEVVSGRRNNAFSDNTCPLLQMVWNLYQKGKLCEAVDPLLEGNFQEEAALRLLLIGLLCAQASAGLRPAMSKVVKMLINHHDLPQPTQPPFLNSSYAE